MRQTERPALLPRRYATMARYAASALALCMALLLRLLLDPWLGDSVPFITLYGAVAAAVWFGGVVPAAAVAAIGYVASLTLFIAPRGTLSIANAPGLVALAAFVFTSGIVIVFGEALRRQGRAARLQEELQRITLASIADGVIVTDAQARITAINPVAEALTGCDDGRALGRPLNDVLRLVHAAGGAPLPDPAHAVLVHGCASGPLGEAVLIAQDGRRTAVDERAAPLRNALGETLGMVLVLRDVGAGRAAAVRLRENERRLRMALAAARMVAWEYDPADDRLSFTGDLPALAGLEPDALPARGEDFRRLLHPQDRPAHEARLHAALARGGSYTSSYRIVRPSDGRPVWVEEQAQAFGAPGETVYLAGVLMDISEAQRDAHLLTGQKRVLEMVATGAPMDQVLAELAATLEAHDPSMVCAVLLVDERLHCLRRGAGPALLDEYVSAIEGASLAAPHDNPCAAAADSGREVVVSDVERDPRWQPGWRAQALRHGLRACRALPVRVSDGRVAAVLAIYHREPQSAAPGDPRGVLAATQLLGIVVERRRAADALAADLAAMTRLQALSTRLVRATELAPVLEEALSVAFALTGADQGEIRLVDGEGERYVFGARHQLGARLAAALLAQAPALPDAPLPEGQHLVIEDLAQDGDGGALHEAALADGVRALQCTPLVGRDGRLLGLMGTYFHAPQRLEERALRGLHLLARMTADFIERQAAEQALRQADRRKDEFIATLAHELRNPLAPIRHAADLLQRPGQEPSRVQDTAAMLQRQVRQLVRLVDDLLDVSRVSRGRILLRPVRTDLASIVAQAVEAAAPVLQRRGHELDVRLPGGPLPLRADPARLAQVIGNLLSNAAKFSDDGSRIGLEVERDVDHALLTVRDSGIGIEPAQLQRIFDLFVQVDTSLERSTSGLGIGLTLARLLVDLHGGTLSAHSEGPGRGSAFVVRLPLLGAAPAPPEPLPSGRTTARHARRVLVVDDNVDGALSLAELLRLSGHRAEVAHDGPQALAQAGRMRPDVVLLDIGLPGMNGHEVCRRLRREPWGREILVVAVTGWGQSADRELSRTAGVDAHLVKPVDLDALLALMVTLRPAPAV